MLISEPASRRKPRLPLFQSRDLVDPLPEPLGGDVVAEAVAGRVVGDRHVGVAALAAGVGHLLERVAAVGEGRVASAGRRGCRRPSTSSGSFALARRLQLAAALAQLGLDVGVAEALVDLLLGRAELDLAALDLGDPVLGDGEAARHRLLAQLHVVRLGAGEVLEQVAEGLRGDDPQVDRDPVVGLRPHAVRARVPGRGDQRAGGEVLGQRRGLLGGRDQVDVLAGLGPAPHRARHLDPVGGGMLAQRRAPAPRRSAAPSRAAPARTPRSGSPSRSSAASTFSSDLRAEALQLADALRLRRRLQVLQRGDAELVEEAPRGLRPHPRHPRHLDQGRRELRLQLHRGGDLAGLQQRVDLFRQRLADAGDLGRPPAAARSATETGLSRIALAAVL